MPEVISKELTLGFTFIINKINLAKQHKICYNTYGKIYFVSGELIYEHSDIRNIEKLRYKESGTLFQRETDKIPIYHMREKELTGANIEH